VCLVDLEDRGSAAVLAQPAHHLVLAAERDVQPADTAVRHPLDGAEPGARHGADDPGELALVRVGARHRHTALRPVPLHPVGREAESAGLDGLGHEARHLCDVVGVRGFVRRATLAHHVAPQRAVRHLRADVDRARDAVEHVEVLGERLPSPRDAFVERGAGDVLDPFHQLDEPLVAIRRDRREAHAAVAHDHGGDAVQRRRLEERVPRGLPVVVAVDVDESRRDDQARSVDDLGRLGAHRADGSDLAAVDRHIRHERRAARAVDDETPANHQLMHMCPHDPRARRPARPSP
jgi:hypothetical protein